MYKTQAETRVFFDVFLPLVANSKHCDIVVAPPFTALDVAARATRGTSVAIAAQNVHGQKEGAFTGEICAPMIVEVGCTAVIIGHSERRQYYNESDEAVHRKTKAALEEGLTPIVCVGEILSEREGNLTEAVLKRQFEGGLGALTPDEFSRILLAYEPVWAIGTGRNATDGQAQEVHAFLREQIAKKWNKDFADRVRIQYGGSMKPDNARALLSQPDVDGGLIGGASLKAETFLPIATAAL